MLLLAVALDCGGVLLTISPPIIRGSGHAIFAGCPGIPGGIPDPRRSSGDDNRRGGAAGSQNRCIPTAPVDISMAGRIAHSRGIAARSYRRLSHGSQILFRRRDLETAVEWVPRPGRWLVSLTTKPAESLSFYTGVDTHMKGAELPCSTIAFRRPRSPRMSLLCSPML